MGTFVQHFRITEYMARQGQNKRLMEGLSKKQLAHRMRVSLDTVRRLEAGGCECRMNTVFEWARQLDTTVTRLHNGPDFTVPEALDTTALLHSVPDPAKPHRQANVQRAFQVASLPPRFLSHRAASLGQMVRRLAANLKERICDIR